MTPTSLSRLGIACQQRFSLLHPSRQAIVAELLRAWTDDATGAIAQAETTLSRHHPALFAEYRSFMDANRLAPMRSKAEMWCRQELDEPMVLSTPVLSPEPKHVPEPTCLLLNKRHRPSVHDGGFKQPKPVRRTDLTMVRVQRPILQPSSDLQDVMQLHALLAVQMKQIQVKALSMALAKCRAFMDRFR